jgi:hypothetical protein
LKNTNITVILKNVNVFGKIFWDLCGICPKEIPARKKVSFA